jgi:hypothetical protein
MDVLDSDMDVQDSDMDVQDSEWALVVPALIGVAQLAGLIWLFARRRDSVGMARSA